MSDTILSAVQEEQVVLPGAAVEKLLFSGNGDAALLYLALLRERTAVQAGALCTRLGWHRERLDAAARALHDMALLVGGEHAKPAKQQEKPVLPPAQERAEYTNADLLGALERSEFASLSAAIEQALGKKLNTHDHKILLGLYDDLGMSADVIFLLVNFCLERSAARYGEGRRPTMRQIEQEGYAWVRLELNDQERASAYIRKYNRQRETLPKMMHLLGLGERKLSVSEERYLVAWSEMGFEEAAIELAYDKTILKCKELKWPYMNKILTAWHEKGLHTVEAVQEGDRGAAARNAAVSEGEEAARREDLERMEKYLRQLRQEREKGGQ